MSPHAVVMHAVTPGARGPGPKQLAIDLNRATTACMP